MLGNFTYCNPTKLYFGEDSLDNLNTELPKYGNNIVLIYGGGSVKKNGIYGSILRILRLMLEQQMKDMIIKDGGDMIHYQNLNQ